MTYGPPLKHKKKKAREDLLAKLQHFKTVQGCTILCAFEKKAKLLTMIICTMTITTSIWK